MIQVLIADSDAYEIEVIKRMIDWERFDLHLVGTATTEKTLMREMSAYHPELLITDVIFDNQDIFDLLREISRRFAGVRCLVISEEATFANAKKCLQLRTVSDFIAKPLNRLELNRSLGNVLLEIRPNQGDYTPYSRVMAQAKSYVDLHFDLKITLTDVAENVYVSASYLASMFHKELGVGFRDYLIRVRMREACRLLTNYPYSVSEISRMVGFANPKYFREHFLRYTGMTPTAYRNRK